MLLESIFKSDVKKGPTIAMAEVHFGLLM